MIRMKTRTDKCTKNSTKNQQDSTESKETASKTKDDVVSKDSKELKKLISKKSMDGGKPGVGTEGNVSVTASAVEAKVSTGVERRRTVDAAATTVVVEGSEESSKVPTSEGVALSAQNSKRFKEIFENCESDSNDSESESVSVTCNNSPPDRATGAETPTEEGQIYESEDDEPLRVSKKSKTRKRESAKCTEQRAVPNPDDPWDARNDPSKEELDRMVAQMKADPFSRDPYPHVNAWKPDYSEIKHHYGHRNPDVWKQYENWCMARGKTQPRTYRGYEESWKQFTSLYNQGEFAWGNRLRKLACQTKNYKSEPSKQMLDMKRLEREFGVVRSKSINKSADRKRKAVGDDDGKPNKIHRKASSSDLSPRSYGGDGRGYSPPTTPHSPASRTDNSSRFSARSPSRDREHPAPGSHEKPRLPEGNRTILPNSEDMKNFHVCTDECFQRPIVECLLCQLWAEVVVLMENSQRLFSMVYKNEEKFENELVALRATCSQNLANEMRVIDQRLFELREEDQKILKEVASVDRKHEKELMELRKQNVELREKNCSLMERLSSFEGQMNRLHRKVETLERNTSSTSPDRTPDSDASY